MPAHRWGILGDGARVGEEVAAQAYVLPFSSSPCGSASELYMWTSLKETVKPQAQ